jgi:hypothetical protein
MVIKCHYLYYDLVIFLLYLSFCFLMQRIHIRQVMQASSATFIQNSAHAGEGRGQSIHLRFVFVNSKIFEKSSSFSWTDRSACLFRTVPVALTGAVQLGAEGISSCCIL